MIFYPGIQTSELGIIILWHLKICNQTSNNKCCLCWCAYGWNNKSCPLHCCTVILFHVRISAAIRIGAIQWYRGEPCWSCGIGCTLCWGGRGAQKCREFYSLLWFLLDWTPVLLSCWGGDIFSNWLSLLLGPCTSTFNIGFPSH